MTGVLKGYDQLFNLVLDEVEEQIQGTKSISALSSTLPFFIDLEFHWHLVDPEPRTRTLGLTVVRGPTITLICPVDGLEEISNPFIAQD